MISVDTNLLVYAHLESAREHESAKQALQSAARHPGGWAITHFAVAELWSVLTHPAHRPVVDSANVVAYLKALGRAGARILQPGPGFTMRLMDHANRQRIRGRRIYDLQIALVSLESGATEIWSHDLDFHSLPELPVRDPLQAVR